MLDGVHPLLTSIVFVGLLRGVRYVECPVNKVTSVIKEENSFESIFFPPTLSFKCYLELCKSRVQAWGESEMRDIIIRRPSSARASYCIHSGDADVLLFLLLLVLLLLLARLHCLILNEPCGLWLCATANSTHLIVYGNDLGCL